MPATQSDETGKLSRSLAIIAPAAVAIKLIEFRSWPTRIIGERFGMELSRRGGKIKV
jgi:hypothetical protein